MKLTIFSKRNRLLLLALCGLLLTSCAGLPSTPPATSSPTLTETPSPTIQWFPATNTPTPLPVQTPTPTPETRPGTGDLLFTDPFDRPDLWNTASSSTASATVTGGRLVLSVTGKGPLSILSLRSQPVLGDFYAEVNVAISLCRDKDEFGLIFRAAGGDYYRFVLTCNGQTRLERSNAGSLWPLSNWLSSGDVPLGAPAQVKLGVWAVGSEMRFSLNDNFQFAARDPALKSGTLGFFAYANGETPVAVAYSDLTVNSASVITP